MLCADFRTSKHQLIKEFVTFFRACLWRTPACVWWRKREGFASDDEVDRLPDSRAVSVNFYTSNAQSLKLALNFSSTWRSDPETSSRLMNRPPDHWSGEKIDKTSLFKTNWNDEEKKKIFWRFPRKRQRHKKRDHLKIDEREIFCLINFCSLSIGGEHKKFKSFQTRDIVFWLFFARATIKIELKCLSAACRREWNVPSLAWELLAWLKTFSPDVASSVYFEMGFQGRVANSPRSEEILAIKGGVAKRPRI